MIKLGSKVKDKITGFEGIAVARTTWLTGCDRYTVQPQTLDKDGKVHETVTFDEPMLVVLESAAETKLAPKASNVKGGPRPEPVRR